MELLRRHLDAPGDQETGRAIGARPAIDELPVVLVSERRVVLSLPRRTGRQEPVEHPLPRHLVHGCGVGDNPVEVRDHGVKIRAGERDHGVHRHLRG